MTTTSTTRALAFIVLPSEISKNNMLTLSSARNSIQITSHRITALTSICIWLIQTTNKQSAFNLFNLGWNGLICKTGIYGRSENFSCDRYLSTRRASPLRIIIIYVSFLFMYFTVKLKIVLPDCDYYDLICVKDQ